MTKKMERIYEAEPNTVRVMMSDRTGERERWVVGLSLDELLSKLSSLLFFGETPPAKKIRRKRRTKAEMRQTRAADEAHDNLSPANVLLEEKPAAEKPTKKGKKERVWPGQELGG